MENKKNKNFQKILFNKIKNKKLNTFSSEFDSKNNLNKTKVSKNSKNNKNIQKEKRIIKSKKNKPISMQKTLNKIIWETLNNLKEEKTSNIKSKERNISTIEVEKNLNKKRTFNRIINKNQNKFETKVIKSKYTNPKIERSSTLQVFGVKGQKKNLFFNVNNLVCPINNIRTIDTELHHGSDRGVEKKNSTKGNIKNIIKEFKKIQDNIDANTTNQDTNYKSEKYLSVLLFNMKKYKMLFQKYKKENDILKEENIELKNKIQDAKDELDIMKEEIEINKDYNKENEKKFNELKDYIKQNTINYEQKIFNLKELLFSKDEEINKLNKIIDNKDIKNSKIIEDLKKRLSIQEQTIQTQQKLINELKQN